MPSAKRGLCACAALVGTLALPDTALAHVGKNAPVATNFEATISAVQPASSAMEAKIVDGDRELWLRVSPRTTLVVPGAVGEPLLRFDRAGVFVNLRSPTAQSDRIDPFALHPGPNPKDPPMWHRLTSGHSYRWHEHRLHALERLARGHRTSGVIGRWAVPLLIDGKRYALAGTLVYHPPGSVWPWIMLACGLAVTCAAVLGVSARAARQLAVLAALAGTLLVWLVRIGRELYGRPAIGVGAYILLVLTSLVGLTLLWGLLHHDEEARQFTAFLVAFGCLYQGLTMLPVMTHAVALTTLPTAVVRPSVAVILGVGGGVLAITLHEQFAGKLGQAPKEDVRRHDIRRPHRSGTT